MTATDNIYNYDLRYGINDKPFAIETKILDEKQNQPSLTISLAGVAGNVLEWYDFAVFGYFSDIISENFFPSDQDEITSLIQTFVVFGAAFLVRPIGGLMIGKLGDTNGRQEALEKSIFLMTFPTFALGCLPTFSQIGWMSTIFLVMMRIFQGLSVGGQLMSSVMFTLERTHRSNWGFWGSSVYAASSVGVTLGSIMAYLLHKVLTEEQLYSWGWRIPFWLGILGVLPAMFLRAQNEESNSVIPSSTPIEGNNNLPAKDTKVFTEMFSKSNRPALIASLLLPCLPSAAYYIVFIWLVTFMEVIVDPPVPNAFAINSIVGVIGGIFFTLLGGLFTDLIGNYRKLLMFSGVLLAILSPISLGLIGKGWNNTDASVTMVALLIQLSLGFILSIWNGAMLPWMILKFPPEIRLTSASLGYNFAVCIFGGFAPAISTALVTKFNNFAPGFFVSGAALLSLMGVFIASSTDNILDDPYNKGQSYAERESKTIFDGYENENKNESEIEMN